VLRVRFWLAIATVAQLTKAQRNPMSPSPPSLPDESEICPIPRLTRWQRRLQDRYNDRIRVRFTRNARSMISIRREAGGPVHLRVHMAFELAPLHVFEDLEAVIARDNAGAWRRTCEYARTMPMPEHFAPRPRRVTLQQEGEHHHLQELLDEVNARYFGGSLNARITWGRSHGPRRRGRYTRSFQFGVWDATRKLIRIHPRLDDKKVPAEFLRYVIHHELCHAAAPPRKGRGGRRQVHHPDFEELADGYPHRTAMEAMGRRLFEKFVAG
jgi:hypothetical protein